MTTSAERVSFFKEEVPVKLVNLTEETQANWGIMTPQHMLEHVEMVLLMMLDKTDYPIMTPPDKLEKARAFLWNPEKTFRPNTQAPFLKGELVPLKYENLNKAKSAVLAAIDRFYHTWEEQPDLKTNHFSFGQLDMRDLEQFQHKHFTHHFKQFGLIQP
ncbi:MAG: hypothetical protein AAGI38_02475 [Bacteroidota bacterium]